MIHLPNPLNAVDLRDAYLPPRQSILEPILAQKSLAMLYGPRGLGKTFVALGMAWAAASGESFLKWRADRPHHVLYIDGEMAAVDMKERLRQLGPAPPTLDFLIADLHAEALPDLGQFDAGQALWMSWPTTPELVVLDNLSSLMRFESGGPESWTRVQRWLVAMRRAGIAVLIVHHANKQGDQRGTSRREDVLDIVMSMRRPSDYETRDGARFELHFEKARGLSGEHVDPIEARMALDDGGAIRWHWRAAQQSQLDRVVALLSDGLNARQVARELGLSLAQSYRLRKRAIETGLVEAAQG
jgi:hypothetical protein